MRTTRARRALLALAALLVVAGAAAAGVEAMDGDGTTMACTAYVTPVWFGVGASEVSEATCEPQEDRAAGA